MSMWTARRVLSFMSDASVLGWASCDFVLVSVGIPAKFASLFRAPFALRKGRELWEVANLYGNHLLFRLPML